MAAFPEARPSRPARLARKVAVFALVLFLVAGVSHRQGLLETLAFLWVLALVAALALLALAMVALGFRGIWTRGDLGAGSAALAVVIALAVLSPFAVAAGRLVYYPRLSDISTDLVDPPAMPVAAARRLPGMTPIAPIGPEAVDLQVAAYPEVTGRRYGAAPDRVLEAVDAVIAAEGWQVIARPETAEGEGEYTVEAVARTFVFGFPADVAIRLSDESESTYVDMRSASRYGRADMGDNAARITRFLTALDAEMADQAGR